MSNDNGEKKVKTPEELKAERKARYEVDPGSFVETTDLILGVNRMTGGAGIFIGQATSLELMLARAQIDRAVDKALSSIELAVMKKKKPGIFMPGRGKTRGAFGN